MEKLKLLYSKEQIATRIKVLAQEIESEIPLTKQPLVCVCVLRGAMMFFTDLVREFKRETIWDTLALSSYGNATITSGEVTIIEGLRNSVVGRDVLVIDDICDSGHTVQYIRQLFKDNKAKSVNVVCLLDKPAGRKVDAKADFYGFNLQGNPFIVGYGIDSGGQYRSLAQIYCVG